MMLIFARRMLKLTFCEMGSSGMIDQVVDGFYPRKFELEVSQSSADRQEPNPREPRREACGSMGSNHERCIITMIWEQKTIRLGPYKRGFHLITEQIERAIPEIASVRIGWLQLFLQHTSASLTINENADPDVRTDFETAMNIVVPEDMPFVHTIEGPDDMPAHIRAALTATQLSIPVMNGRLALGTWQGIYVFEHRRSPHKRTVAVHFVGD